MIQDKVRSFLELSADFGEAFLRRSGRGILDGVNLASRLISEFAVIAFAIYFASQLIEAQKVCEMYAPITQDSKAGVSLIPDSKPSPADKSTIFKSE